MKPKLSRRVVVTIMYMSVTTTLRDIFITLKDHDDAKRASLLT